MPLGRVGRKIRSAPLLLMLVAFAASGTADAASSALKGRIIGQDKLVPDVFAEAAKPESHRFTWREPSPAVDPKFRVLMANPSRDVCIAAIANTLWPIAFLLPALVVAVKWRVIAVQTGHRPPGD